MISLDVWRTGGAIFDTAQGALFTRHEGSPAAPALLFIHGFPTASWDWARIWPAFTPHFHCLTLDMLGFGFSAKPPEADYSIALQADLFESWLRSLAIDRYACVAHDYGDTVAQELLARQAMDETRGPRMTRLVLLNGGLFPETHKPVLIQKLLASPVGPLIARLTTRGKFAANMRRICTKPLTEAELDGMWQLMRASGGLAILPKLIGYMAERRRHRARWVGALQQSPVPIRLIDGVDDPISGAHMVARYRQLIAAPDIVELAGVGHYPQVEAPQAVIEAALPFLRG